MINKQKTLALKFSGPSSMAVSEEECSSANSRSSSSASSSSSHYLAKCVLRGSVVLQVLYGHIRFPTSYDVVFGKETSIELVIIGEDGIVQSICEQPVFGTIKDIAILPSNDKFRTQNPQMLGKDLLVVISDSGNLSFLSFCNEMHRFFPVTQVQLSNPGNSRNQLGRMLAIDSSGCFIAASAYENQLAMFSVSVSGGSDIIDKKIVFPQEKEADASAARVQKNSICGTIWSMSFISKDPSQSSKGHNPVLAILLNREGDALLMDLRDAQIPYCVHRTSPNFLSNVVDEANFVQESSRGCDLSRVLQVDDEGDTGEYFMIEIIFGPDGLKVQESECLYKGLPSKAVLWVEGGFLAAIIEMGDGMIHKSAVRLCLPTKAAHSEGIPLPSPVEMVHSKRLNVQKFHLGGTPREVLYHSESRLLLVMRTDLSNDTSSSDICCVDPLSGSVLSSFKLEPGETGKSMELVRVGNEQVLVVGTSLSSGPAIMPSGEAESTKGRLIVLCLEHVQNSDSGSMTLCSKAGSSSQRASPFHEIVGYATEQFSSSSLCSSPDDTSCDGIKLEETEAWQFRLAYVTKWPGMVLAICPYLDRYFLASSGNAFYVCGFPNDNSQRVRKFAWARTRFMITSLTAHFTTIAVGDCRDGVLFYAYHEDSKKLQQLYFDPCQRLVADCILMDVNTAVVSDRKGSIAVLSCADYLEDTASPECNLTVSCAYYMGEIAMSIRKGSFSYKLPADDVLKGCDGNIDFSQNAIIVSTLLGSIITFVPISREEYELLEAVQDRLVVHPLTAPILGNDHNEYRSRENPVGVPKILDGDMLSQFLELTGMQQEAVLSSPLGAQGTVKPRLKSRYALIPVNQVVQLLERVHYALN
ncbi:Cleavage and polyadenylation specificity factor A subunit protein [Prunus dulcis]|uniref:Cleavage and polyadenylation specificity factor A subunit protein n=1 Tax=Prunus dulcis TaxID=3755 RepID=A0A4Y1RT40_PRUDU|nr:Cleavage and polyadenylation specificity factor A subunit protein [Prunus dulcis]